MCNASSIKFGIQLNHYIASNTVPCGMECFWHEVTNTVKQNVYTLFCINQKNLPLNRTKAQGNPFFFIASNIICAWFGGTT